MTHPLDGAFERVNRAGEHIDDLMQQIKELTCTSEQAVLDGLDLGNVKIKLDTLILPLPLNTQPFFPVPLRYSILVGETLYNLRAALDYLVYELARHDAGTAQERTQFPITMTPEKFAGEQRDRLKSLSVEHVAMIEKLQPYPDRKECEWLADLQKLSNPDKHKTLTAMPTLLLGFVELLRFNPRLSGDDGPIRITQDIHGQDIYVKYPLHLAVSIDDGIPVDDVLGLLKLRVRQTLERFKSEFYASPSIKPFSSASPLVPAQL
jgi:hypothetical protein